MRFETDPPVGRGTLLVKHGLSLDRLFQNSRSLKAADVQPGEKFRIKIIGWEYWQFDGGRATAGC